MSRYNPNIHHRRSIRLEGYDYAQAGAYFVTICAYARECLFGEIDADAMMLSEFGEIVRDEWLKSCAIRSEIKLGAYIVMPNHFHGIIEIAGITTENKTIGDMVGAFESITTVEYIRGVKTSDWQTFDRKLWQRNYWEHIIRDEMSYFKISDYILTNPANWDNDTLKN